MRFLSSEEAATRAIRTLGLRDWEGKITSVEVIAAMLRRAAGLMCPCSNRTLVQAVMIALDGLVTEAADTKGLVDSTLEEMVVNGDLLELKNPIEMDVAGQRGILYLAPLTFVQRESYLIILFGIPTDNMMFPSDIEERIEYSGALRYIRTLASEDLVSRLVEVGFMQVSQDTWLKSPAPETATQHLNRVNALLDSSTSSREIPGLQILNSSKPVRNWKSRWEPLYKQDGRFVGRRQQLYGADLWCYVEVVNGRTTRLVDFPLPGTRWRGFDNACQLQAAIDAVSNNHQVFEIRKRMDGAEFHFFSPVPSWAVRRWETLGQKVALERPCTSLFCYEIPSDEAGQEISYCRERLWLKQALTE